MANDQIQFVPATTDDVTKLRALARKSEAHWQYREAFMETFDQTFNITEKFIMEHPVYVLWQGIEPVAFWGLMSNGSGTELEYFYVAESKLGKGYGKQMWNHMIQWCEEHKVEEIHFVTSHPAIGFYERMGAIQDKMAESMIDGRKIPHFVYRI